MLSLLLAWKNISNVGIYVRMSTTPFNGTISWLWKNGSWKNWDKKIKAFKFVWVLLWEFFCVPCLPPHKHMYHIWFLYTLKHQYLGWCVFALLVRAICHFLPLLNVDFGLYSLMHHMYSICYSTVLAQVHGTLSKAKIHYIKPSSQPEWNFITPQELAFYQRNGSRIVWNIRLFWSLNSRVYTTPKHCVNLSPALQRKFNISRLSFHYLESLSLTLAIRISGDTKLVINLII